MSDKEYSKQRDVVTTVTTEDGVLIDQSTFRTSGDVASVALATLNKKRTMLGCAPVSALTAKMIVQYGEHAGVEFMHNGHKYTIIPVATDSDGRKDPTTCPMCGVSAGFHVTSCSMTSKKIAASGVKLADLIKKSK